MVSVIIFFILHKTFKLNILDSNETNSANCPEYFQIDQLKLERNWPSLMIDRCKISSVSVSSPHTIHYFSALLYSSPNDAAYAHLLANVEPKCAT